MATPLNTSTSGVLPISKLFWIASKASTAGNLEAQNFLQQYFPEAEMQQIEFREEEESLVSKKMALLYKGWSDDKILNEIGIVCEHPVGFESWNTFMDFVRSEPPAFLWKLDPSIQAIPKRILVPVDFSSGTERTIPMIKRISQLATDQEIILLNLFNCQKNPKDKEAETVMRREKIDEMKWYLEANLEEAIRDKISLDAIIRFGKENALLLDEYIQDNQVDLVVVGSHNFNHYHYLLYGSTTTDMLTRNAPAHVCVLF